MTAAGPAPHHAAGDTAEEGDLASIGSVLDSLRTDFPEITISKIRFLESEGLISPARTPSGYRQFTPVDVRRLRFVLSAQRDHYLPLKVIRARLAEFDADPSVGEPSLTAPGAPATPAARAASPAAPSAVPSIGSAGGPPNAVSPSAVSPSAVSPAAVPSAGGPGGPPGPGHRPAAGPTALLSRAGGQVGHVGPRGGSAASPLSSAVPSPSPSADDRLGSASSDADDRRPSAPVTRAELLAEDGVDEGLLGALELHGVLRPEADGTYEPEAVGVVRTAAALAALGVEPRLLRGLRAGADREVGLLTQLVTPVARHRGADAASNAEALSEQLAALSGRLHALLVGAGLRRDLRR